MAGSYPDLPISFPFQEGVPDYLTIRTEMEMGYVQTRSKTTIGPRTYSFRHLLMSASQVAAWIAHWNDRKGGGLAFSFTDPRTADTVMCRFNTKAMSNLDDIVQRAGPHTYDIGMIHLEESL